MKEEKSEKSKCSIFRRKFWSNEKIYHVMKPRISENTMQSLSGDKNLIKQSNYHNNDEKKSHANLKKTKKKKKKKKGCSFEVFFKTPVSIFSRLL